MYGILRCFLCFLAFIGLRCAHATVEPCTLRRPRLERFHELIRLWELVDSKIFPVSGAALPVIQLADERCLFSIGSTRSQHLSCATQYVLKSKRGDIPYCGKAHNGKTVLLDGDSHAIAPGGFAEYIEKNPKHPAFLFLPSTEVWLQAPKISKQEKPTDFVLTLGIHELFHVFQLEQKFFREFGVIDSREIRRTFSLNKEFMAMAEKEFDLLKSATETKHLASKKKLIEQFFVLRESRRDKFFVGEFARFRRIESIGATLEGVAEWVRYELLKELRSSALNAELAGIDKLFGNYAAFRKMNDSELAALIFDNKDLEKRIGFAMILSLSQLSADWKTKVHSTSPDLAETLLRRQINL